MLNFLGKKKNALTVGIQLLDNGLAIAVLVRSDESQANISHYRYFPLHEGDKLSALSPELEAYVNEHALRQAHCCLTLRDKDYQLLTVEPPSVPEEEMAEAIKWKVKDLLQFPVSEAIIDLFFQPEVPNSNQKIVNVVAAHRPMIEESEQWVKQIGMSLKAIDIPEMSYRNYFENSGYEKSSIAVVILKENYGKLIVIHQGNVCFSRSFTIAYRGNRYDEIPESEVVLEVQRSLDYYETRLKKNVPNVIFFMGENVVEEKLSAFMSDSFPQEVKLASVDGYDFSEEDKQSFYRIIGAYGAGLRQLLWTGGDK